MEFIDFLGEMLGITKDFAVTKIEKNEFEKTINIQRVERNMPSMIVHLFASGNI